MEDGSNKRKSTVTFRFHITIQNLYNMAVNWIHQFTMNMGCSPSRFTVVELELAAEWRFTVVGIGTEVALLEVALFD